MVAARHPQGHLATHPVVPGDRILHTVGERVAQVQLPSDVGRGDHHHEDALGRHILHIFPTILRLEEALLLPPGIPGK